MRIRDRHGSATLRGVLSIAIFVSACEDVSSWNESQSTGPLLANPSTITFDESGLPPGTTVTNQFAPQGLIVSAPPNALMRVVDDAMVGAWPTASGDLYLAHNTVPSGSPASIAMTTFVDPCGQPTTTDTLSFYAVDSNPVPNPRVAFRTFDADLQFLEERTLEPETALLTFSVGGIAFLVAEDLGGDGHLIDDLTIAVDSDPDDDLVCGGDDNCPDTANPDQSDIDGDGLGDACDPCPHTGLCADLKVQIARSLLVTYAIRVSNLGADGAPNVRLHVDLPPGLVLSAFGGTGWSCASVSGDLDCTRPALAAGAQAPAVSLVVVPLPLPATLSATVSSDAGDPDPGNNTASAPVPGGL